jgi:hypothetical protein
VLLESRSMVPPSLALDRLRLGSEPGTGIPGDDWLSLPFLPAGRYRWWADLSAAGSVELGLLGGRSDGPFESWTVASESAGAVSRDVVLPVGLSGVRVRGDAGARSFVRGVWLQPVLGDERPVFASGRRAASARRYGGVTVYAVASAYLEPDGFWTAGGRTAELVLQTASGERVAAFTLRAGPTATMVELRAGQFGFEADLSPGESRELAIPVSPDGWALVTIRTGRGFRPFEADPASADRRLLGVRLEQKR